MQILGQGLRCPPLLFDEEHFDYYNQFLKHFLINMNYGGSISHFAEATLDTLQGPLVVRGIKSHKQSRRAE